jgi:hypothetical protein
MAIHPNVPLSAKRVNDAPVYYVVARLATKHISRRTKPFSASHANILKP